MNMFMSSMYMYVYILFNNKFGESTQLASCYTAKVALTDKEKRSGRQKGVKASFGEWTSCSRRDLETYRFS